MSNGDQTSGNARNNGMSHSPRDALQAQLQTIEISGSTPGRSAPDFDPGANVWDFQNLDFMEDTSLWTMDNGFAMNGIEDATSGQPPDLHLQLFDYSVDNDISNGHDHPERPGLPIVLDMRNIWFTKVQRSDESQYHPSCLAESTTTSQPTSSPREPEIVDEECRRDLTRSLSHPFPQEDLLPSSGFLVEYLPSSIGAMLTRGRICASADISRVSTRFSQ
jgi:hypothetical protein